MLELIEIKKIGRRTWSSHSAILMMLIPMFFIVSSSVYPAIFSGIQNKEMALIAEALAQVQDSKDRGVFDTSNHHSSIPTPNSPTPTAVAPTSISSISGFSDSGSSSNKELPTTQAALTSPSTKQTNNIVNTQSEFAVSFKTSTTGIIKKILVTFPAGTNLGSVNLLITREGIGPGTAEKTSSTTITYTVTSAVSVPAGTLIKLEFGTIVNSPNPGNQFVTVSTRDAANAIIDGPTAIGYSLKQIGTGDIADNAITSSKPALEFMKRVTVPDSPAGNAIGWDPNGASATFTISEPDVTGPNTAFTGIIVDDATSTTNYACDVVRQLPGSFILTCSSPPPAGSFLDYMLVNLPSTPF